mgnify:CR=1 FL=1
MPTLNRKGFVRIPSLRGRGFSCITASLWGSRPRAMAGRESVRRLINSRCTGRKGLGRPRMEVTKTLKMPAILPESRKVMAFLMLVYTPRPLTTGLPELPPVVWFVARKATGTVPSTAQRP